MAVNFPDEPSGGMLRRTGGASVTGASLPVVPLAPGRLRPPTGAYFPVALIGAAELDVAPGFTCVEGFLSITVSVPVWRTGIPFAQV
jgi:hypothetical protein